MRKLEMVVLNTFLDQYPPDATYEQVISMMGNSKKVTLMETFEKCDIQHIREQMYFLYVDITNLVTHELLEYDRKFLNSSLGDKNVAVR